MLDGSLKNTLEPSSEAILYLDRVHVHFRGFTVLSCGINAFRSFLQTPCKAEPHKPLLESCHNSSDSLFVVYMQRR